MRRIALPLVVVAGLVWILAGCTWWLTPSITVSPNAGAVHTLVTIRGEGFGNTQGESTVSIWATHAPIVSWSDTEIVCRVPVIPTPDGLPVDTSLMVTIRGSDFDYFDTPFTVVRGILFSTNREGDLEIYVMNPDGSGQANLSFNYAEDSEPCWSPDGTQIVFETRVGTDAPSLRLMNADGSQRTVLTDNPLHYEETPRWAPGGSRILYASELAPPQQLFTIRPDATGMSQVTDFNVVGVFDPAWSPDGSQIVCAVADGFQETDTRLVKMNADGTGAVYLTSSGNGDSMPSWSPDGQWIVFSRLRPGGGNMLMVIRPDGTEEAELTGPGVGLAMHPSWSPNGLAIVFYGYLGDQRQAADIFLIDLEEEAVHQLTNDPSIDADPYWGS